jgi:acyl carrier protein
LTNPLTIIRDEINRPFRYPPAPEITPETLLDSWFTQMDRLTVQMALDEAFGFEISDAEAARWQSVADILGTVVGRERVDG